jgi:signal transduction histidine kinase
MFAYVRDVRKWARRHPELTREEDIRYWLQAYPEESVSSRGEQSRHEEDGGAEVDFLAGGGELAERIREFDWSHTPLGPLRQWPQSLRMAVNLMLNSRHPMWIGWGPEATFLYNDAYISVLSLAKHPWALGRPAAEVWAEIWNICAPLVEKVFGHGEAVFADEVQLFMNRGDFVEETYYSFSYSPIRDEMGRVAGLFCPSAEVTPKVLTARRVATLAELSANALLEKTVQGATASVFTTLAKNSSDVPFALLYLLEPDGLSARLVIQSGLTGAFAEVAPAHMVFAAAGVPWPVKEVADSGSLRVIPVPASTALPPGLSGQPITLAVALPVAARAADRPWGVLVAGVNPARPLDVEYRTFFGLVADQLATAIQNAQSAEEERQRAEQLAELDRAKTTFFSNVSHELRTPLTLMMGPIEDLLRKAREVREEAPVDDLDTLTVVHRNCLRLLKLVNTLLDFSRIEAGRLEPSCEPTDLAAFTAELAGAFRASAERAGLRFSVDCEPLVSLVPVDRDMWEKIVFNLLSNALKYTLAGGIEVRLRAEGGRVILTVRDTGCGIPEAELPRVFERFHRVRGAEARTHEGSGIGLALVRELTRLHGGDAQVESEPGKGCAFTISLPADRVPATERTAASEPVQPAAGDRALAFLEEALRGISPAEVVTPAQGGSSAGRILLAEDNADMRGYISRLLVENGYDVYAAGDGQAALEAVRSAPPDLVLSDVMMPRLDGFSLAKALRGDAATRTLPIILLTARAGEEAKVEGIEAGADDYLTKPFSARELVARVRTHLKLARIRKEVELALRAAKEEAEAASRAKDDFLAVLSHELRTPLTPVLMAATALHEDETVPADVREQLGMIRRNVALEARLIDDLLDLTRITRGKLVLRVEPCDVHSLLQHTVEIVREHAREKQIAMTLELEAARHHLDGDPARLQQVFWNLLRNAVKFTPPLGSIRVRSFNEAGELGVAVTDNGAGFDPEAAERIFEPFVQTGSSEQVRAEGLGLGLAIARAVVQVHEGAIRAESAGPGQGATFTVRLPRAKDGAATVPPPASPEPHGKEEFSLRALRLLVVEDHEPTLQVLTRILSRAGHDVVPVGSLAHALEAARGRTFDLLISDLGLPDGTGNQLMAELRSLYGLRGIALSGYGMEDDVHRSEMAGFAAHLVKPVDPNELKRLIRNLGA